LSWKTSLTILVYKKGNPTHLSNYCPIALANTIYKLFTSTLTTILIAYKEKHQILHNSQKGFCVERCTSKQLQLLIGGLEKAKFTNKNIYLLFIDFKNAFGSINHAKLFAVMHDLGYPEDAVHLIGNIYSQSHTIITREYFGQTKPIPISRGTIQGDILNPYIFLIFLEPLLRWLDKGNLRYPLSTFQSTITSAAYANDLVIISDKIFSISPQIHRCAKYKIIFFVMQDAVNLNVFPQK
jgi:hypothetical protein